MGCEKEKANLFVPNQVEGKLTRIQTNAAFLPRDSGGEVLFKDSMWLLGGVTPDRSNEVWNSSDGITWIQKSDASWSPRNLMCAVEFQGKLWLMGGFNGVAALNDIYSSVDGSHWNLETKNAPWPARSAFGLVVLNNKLILFGGMRDDFYPMNDVWESVDGVNWTLLTANAQWSPRAMFGCVVYANEIYLIAGGVYNTDYVYNQKNNFQDVWKSSDGVNWIKIASKTPFSARRFLNSFVLNNRIFAGSGFCLDARIFQDTINGLLKSSLASEELTFYSNDKGRHYGNLNDIWSSANGVDWHNVSLNDTFPIRHEASVIVKNNEAYWIGGFGLDLYNDIWKLKITLH